MSGPSPHLIKQIEDRLQKLGASDVVRIEIMGFVDDIYNDGRESIEDEDDHVDAYNNGYADGYADCKEEMGGDE